MKIEKKCEICQKIFYIHPSTLKRGKGRFCSRKCCGVWRSQENNGEKNPHWKGGKIPTKCEICQKVFYVWQSGSKYNRGKFCSNKCYNVGRSQKYSGEKSPNWKGGLSSQGYAGDWTQTLKRSIRERDNYVCQLCKKLQTDIAFHVHHINYDKKNCDPSNLITLCCSCHMKTNAHRDKWPQYLLSLLNN